MTASVIVRDNASLTFKVFRNRSPHLGERLIGLMDSERHHLDQVQEFKALQDINLEIKAGERVGIIGFNGAGKSTLLKLILGIYPPDTGEIIVSGSVAPLLDLTGHFDFELSGRDNMHLKGAYLGYSTKEIRALEESVIEFAELEDFVDLPVKYYSSGMIGRLAFAIATMLHAEILLLDEVFAVGDGYFVHKATQRMMSLINKSQIVIMVSHNIEHIQQICTKVIWMHRGRIVEIGSVDEMLSQYRLFIEQQDGFSSERSLPG